MKTYRIIFCLSLFALISQTGFGQDYTFKVLVNKGKNEVKTGSTWQLIKTGTVLKSSDEVKVVDNSYLGLVHASGKPLELKQPGNYKVVDLSARVQGSTSVLNKYTDFILSSNAEKRNRLAATGAVHRGAHTTHVFLPKPEHAVVFGDKLILNWEKTKSDTVVTYIVALKSLFDDELFKTETIDSTVTINLSEAKFLNEDNIIVEVYPKGENSSPPDPPYMVKKLSSADKSRIKTQLAEVTSETDDNNALNKLILAVFYEQNKLLIDAGTAYLEAIQLAPDVEMFREDYESFLIRNGIKDEKK